MARLGLDLHDVGLRLVTKALRDGGMEVIYLGTRNTPEQVVGAAINEDVDIIGLSFWGEDYFFWLSDVVRLLKENKGENIAIVIGGRIFEEDMPELRELGIRGIFPTDTPLQEILDACRKLGGGER